jgi:hypothetical protein
MKKERGSRNQIIIGGRARKFGYKSWSSWSALRSVAGRQEIVQVIFNATIRYYIIGTIVSIGSLLSA